MSRLFQIKASAGSGKTYTLTHCFLNLLRQSREQQFKQTLNAIVAITFTNAAASEMRQRILRYLKEAALNPSKKKTAFPADAAKHWVNYLLQDPDALNVRTIDSLLHLFMRMSALQQGLNPDYQPVFNLEDNLAPFFTLLLEFARDQNQTEFINLLIRAFRILNTYDTPTGFYVSKTFFADRLWPFLEIIATGQCQNLTSPEILEAKFQVLSQQVVAQASTLLASSADSTWRTQKAINNFFAPLAEGNLQVLNPAKTTFAAKEKIEDFFKNCSATTAEHLEKFLTIARKYRIFQLALRSAPFVRLGETLFQEFMQSEDSAAIFPNILLPYFIHRLFSGEGSVPDALYRVGTDLTHFLIDEFQDTSDAQWFALYPLVQEALARGGSLTWVGDVKQSIFSWRGGNPALFDDIRKDKTLNALCLGQNKCENLAHNWRSSAVVIEHNNTFFDQLTKPSVAGDVLHHLLHLTQVKKEKMPPEIFSDTVEQLCSIFKDVQQQPSPAAKKQQAGLVKVDNVPKDDVPAKVVELLKEINSRRQWADVLILVRTNKDESDLAETLLLNAIPVITENSLLLAKNPLIIQTVDLLHFLNNPDDDLAFWTVLCGHVLRTPLEQCGLSFANLLHWKMTLTEKGSLRGLFQKHWPEVWQKFFAPFFSRSTLLTPYDLVAEWFKRMNMEQRYPQAVVFLRRFLEVLYAAEAKGLATLPAFLEYWTDSKAEEKVPMPHGLDAVRIMTIHQAKGLEAPVVLVPWTNFSAKLSARIVTLQVDNLNIAVQVTRKTWPDYYLRKEYYENYLRTACEEINLLYVAFTRATDELYVFSNATKPEEADVLHLLAQSAGWSIPYTFGNALNKNFLLTLPQEETTLALSEADAHFWQDTNNCNPEWRPMHWLPELNIFHHFRSEVQNAEVERGILLHRCLEYNSFSDNIAQDVDNALNFGLCHTPLHSLRADAPLLASLREDLFWFFSQPEARYWLETGQSEQTLLTPTGQLLRMDLLVPDGHNGCLVLDYKSGTPQEEHLTQIRQYLHLLAQSNTGWQNLRGLIVYLDRHRFRLVTANSAGDLCANYQACLQQKTFCM